jgi:hypothetical protein
MRRQNAGARTSRHVFMNLQLSFTDKDHARLSFLLMTR